MIPSQRQDLIRNYLAQQGTVRIPILSEELGISVSTLRRDIKCMADHGEIQPLRGGAIKLCSGNIELHLDTKLLLNADKKDKIARHAASMVTDGEVIFLDPSSTNSLLIDYFSEKQITVITNSIAHINKLSQNGTNCILIGGQIKQATSSCIGPAAEGMLKELFFTHCFLGANGVSAQQGITNHDLRERDIKMIAIAHATTPVFLIDSSKFDQVAMCKVARIDEYPIITDQIDESYAQYDNIILA